jgi:hypothetical protein
MKNKGVNFSSKYSSVNKPSAVGIFIIICLQKVFKESSILLAMLLTEGYKIYLNAEKNMEKAVVKTYK